MFWFDNAVIYHIYPFGYCGRLDARDASKQAAENEKSPILRIIKHIPVIKEMGFNAVYIGPMFESVRHGYDTVDYTKIDPRLGTNEDFKFVCKEFKKHEIRIVLDGVFNHVGRDFWAFKDVRSNGLGSKYANWFHVRGGNSNYNDGFYYEGWEGHYDLVKLNLYNPEVRTHLKDAISGWAREFDIDGLRLDVAYCLELDFLRELHSHCKAIKPDFWLMGETLHGDYNKWLSPGILDSVTNYQCYKGLYSSFNDLNMFEIAHSIDRMNGMYGKKQLYIFVDNHDVSRIATALNRAEHLAGVYTLLFTMPGVPGVYYGSEYGATGGKRQGDDILRPEFDIDDQNRTGLTEVISKLANAHAALKPLHAGDYKQVVLQNQFYAFSRSCDGETVYSLINAGASPAVFRLGGSENYTDVLSGGVYDISKEIVLPAYGAMVLAKNYKPDSGCKKKKAEASKLAEISKTPEPLKAPEPPKAHKTPKITEPLQTAETEAYSIIKCALEDVPDKHKVKLARVFEKLTELYKEE
ncbi:MAG: alpha-amylase family glycosyl hydrolase [Oscillospiraceae bacterium]|nr:alpha-amylase family glycosyl hydrolase [Oscillospiraceae bacterium]